MAKAIAEQSYALKTSTLKKWGYFPKAGGAKGGILTWSYRGQESSIGIHIVVGANEEQGYIRLYYTNTDRQSGEVSDMDYRILLLTTACHYGGVRYWFECPLAKNSIACQKRVGVLYGIGKYFGCRHCMEITYYSQLKGGRYRDSSITLSDVEQAQKEINRYYYNGRPTRKYRRFMQLDEKFSKSFLLRAASLDRQFAHFIK